MTAWGTIWGVIELLLMAAFVIVPRQTVTEATVGFTPRKATLKIVFDEDTPLHGLIVRARSCTIGEWNDMLIQAENESGLRGEAAANANDAFASFFLSYVNEWNLELEEGVPSEINLDTWHKLDQGWGSLIIAGWQFAMMNVPKPSKENSDSGKISEEASLGLANMSESLPNWQPPS